MTAGAAPVGKVGLRCAFAYCPGVYRAYRCQKPKGHEGNHIVRYIAGAYRHRYEYEFSPQGRNLTFERGIAALAESESIRDQAYEALKRLPIVEAELAACRAENERLRGELRGARA